jgi:hypothetical protein
MSTQPPRARAAIAAILMFGGGVTLRGVLHVRRIAFLHQILLPRLASAGTTGWITQLSKNVGIPARPVRRPSVPRHPRIRRLTPQGQTEQQRLLQCQ